MNLNIEKKQIDLVSESISVFKTFNHCIDLYKEGRLTFLEMEEFVDDRGKSCLYRLKQMCHDLFRNTCEAAYKEKFYDITVGYIFHEAMKLRECIYQLEYYKPEYTALVNSAELTPAESKVIHEFDMLINKAEKRLAEGLKEVKVLLKELLAACEGPPKRSIRTTTFCRASFSRTKGPSWPFTGRRDTGTSSRRSTSKGGRRSYSRRR